MAESEPASRPEVRAPTGAVRGLRENGVAVFRGIPFAQAPVGALRLAAPRRAPGWGSDVRDAASFGPPPPQGGAVGAPAAGSGALDGEWLTVNVWSPEPVSGAGLPVMVWVQGGGYQIGTSGLPEYDGARLAGDGVVLVTFNYRVGAEGFAMVEGAPANRGLLDQLAALEWVRDNIASFGGDPDRVTVFGESAGGGCIAALLAVPRAAGLFRRAVVQSMPGTFFAPELAREVASAVAAGVGVRPTRAELAAVAPERLAAAGDAVGATMPERAGRWGLAARRRIPFSPVVDEEVLPATPWRALADGAGRGLELLAGHTRDEHRLFALMEGRLGQVTDDLAQEALTSLAPGPDGAHRYHEAFPTAGPEQLYELVESDWLFRMPSLHLAEAQVAGGGVAHVYELAWTAPGLGGALGACHGLDVPLVFGNLEHGQPALLLGSPPPAEARRVSDRMRSAWVSFATRGDPGWPGYVTGHRLTQVFDVESVVAPYPEERSRRIWADHTFPALGLVGG